MTEIIKIEQEKDFPKEFPKDTFIDFLYKHLEEYGDKIKDIKKAINYAFSDKEGKGGFVLIALEDGKIVGGVVINDTGMSGYIPQHILVYIATHKDHRGKGIGKQLIAKVKDVCDGDIALHVEYENPAVHLYKHTGFTSKYMEMRCKNKDV